LLVVISIIALLISMLLPSLGRAKEAAILTRCQSNQHQLAISTHAYITSYNQLPSMGCYGYGYGPGEGTGPWGAFQTNYMTAALWATVRTYPSGALDGTLNYAGIGYIWPQLSGTNADNTNSRNHETGKLFYCPGTKVSFERGHASPVSNYYPSKRPFWEIFQGLAENEPHFYGFANGGRPAFGRNPVLPNMARGTPGSYVWFGGGVAKDLALDPTNDTGWDANWTWFGAPARPDDAMMFNRTWLACASPVGGGNPYNASVNDLNNVAHRGELINAMVSDGSVYTYRGATGDAPLWSWNVTGSLRPSGWGNLYDASQSYATFTKIDWQRRGIR
jgi:type II secretory pathway pseudopilin PulG